MGSTMAQISLPRTLLALLRPRLSHMLESLRQLALLESPSLEKEPADRCCNHLAEEWLLRGAVVQILQQRHRGDHLRVSWAADTLHTSAQLLVLGHYDTVYPSRTLAGMPFRVRGGRAYGPGTFDMKAGIVQALYALEALQQVKIPLRKRLVFLWTSDEEIGSASSRPLIESEAKRSDAVFVLEPSLGPRGLLKTSRKAVGEAALIVHGRASHAGLAPEKGVNAIHELAAQISRIQKWNNHRRGVTINTGLIEGGTRTNVIPDRAKANIDLRAWRSADVIAIEKRLHGLKPIARGAKLEIRGGLDRPALERKRSAELFTHAQSIARQMGFPLGEAAAGGGSDGNFTGALGIPTLDGLGAVGDGAHASDEHVLIRTMPQRAALLAALLATS
jgi:glutamate carboxypeptidase